jgi:hypothetical protein
MSGGATPTAPPITVSQKKVFSGQTQPGKGWQFVSDELFIDVATGNFAKIPTYVVSLGALGDSRGFCRHWKVTGSSSVYPRDRSQPDDLKKGFRVYLRSAEGDDDKIDGIPLNKEFAENHRWYINWVAIEA